MRMTAESHAVAMARYPTHSGISGGGASHQYTVQATAHAAPIADAVATALPAARPAPLAPSLARFHSR